MSPRHDAAFVAVNCGAIPEELVEAELFGHEAGAYTDAKQARAGRFEMADGGTLFLDEVDALPAKAQVSLLRILQEHRFERLGGRNTIACDVRVICATNQDLGQAVEARRFRHDLYYRLNVVPLYIPPLRERPEDIAPLIDCLLERFAKRYDGLEKRLSHAALHTLRQHHWPGNVRELENILERSFLFAEGEVIGHILFDIAGLRSDSSNPDEADPGQDIKQARRQAADRVERQILQRAMSQFDGNIKAVARFLNLSTRAVYQKLAAHDLSTHKASTRLPTE